MKKDKDIRGKYTPVYKMLRIQGKDTDVGPEMGSNLAEHQNLLGKFLYPTPRAMLCCRKALEPEFLKSFPEPRKGRGFSQSHTSNCSKWACSLFPKSTFSMGVAAFEVCSCLFLAQIQALPGAQNIWKPSSILQEYQPWPKGGCLLSSGPDEWVWSFIFVHFKGEIYTHHSSLIWDCLDSSLGTRQGHSTMTGKSGRR